MNLKCHKQIAKHVTMINRQSRENGNIGHTRHRTKTSKNQQCKNTFRSATIAEIRQRTIFNNECTICGSQ